MIKHLRSIALMSVVVSLAACATLYTEYDEKLLENKEFDQSVKVTEMDPPPVITPVETPSGTAESAPPSVSTKKDAKTVKPPKTPKKAAAIAAPVVAGPREPKLEDSAGFSGRRPLVDPYVIGEELEYSVNYFAMEAGRFTIKTRPMVELNGKKSYHFTYQARSSSVFSMFYAVDDFAEVFMDYERLVPYSYVIKARESKQVRDVKTFFNWQTMKAKTWDKKIKKGKGPEEKNYEWELLPYSQNVFSVLFYLRCFQLEVGKELAVRVAHEGKNIIMRAKVLREEKQTVAGQTLDTWVIKPEFEIDGVFKPVGDVFMWLTKDEKKRLVRIESKIKIGTLVVALDKMKP